MMNSDSPSSDYPATRDCPDSPEFLFLSGPLYIDCEETFSNDGANSGVQEMPNIGGYLCTGFERAPTNSLFDGDSGHFLSSPQVTIPDRSDSCDEVSLFAPRSPPVIPTEFSSNVLEGVFVASLHSDHEVPNVSFLHPGGVIPATLRSELPFRFDKEKMCLLLTSFFILFVNCRSYYSVSLGSDVLRELLGHLEVVDNALNRKRLLRRYRSLYYRHFSRLPVDPLVRHRAVFKGRFSPVISLRLDTVDAFYVAPNGL